MIETDLGAIVENLLKYADPEGDAYQKLIRVQAKIKNNVFIGPMTLRWLDSLRERVKPESAAHLDTNIECKGLTVSGPNAGLCKLIPGQGKCPHLERFADCMSYQPVPPLRRTAKIGIGGQ